MVRQFTNVIVENLGKGNVRRTPTSEAAIIPDDASDVHMFGAFRADSLTAAMADVTCGYQSPQGVEVPYWITLPYDGMVVCLSATTFQWQGMTGTITAKVKVLHRDGSPASEASVVFSGNDVEIVSELSVPLPFKRGDEIEVFVSTSGDYTAPTPDHLAVHVGVRYGQVLPTQAEIHLDF